MPHRFLRYQAADGQRLRHGFDLVRAQLSVPTDFPAEVLADAETAVREPTLPDLDRTDIAFVTIDPPGSMDLDQALHIARRPGGYRVHYAIADVAAFVRPGSPLDVEANARGMTLYLPDARTPLYPQSLGEGAASLLPGVTRPALLWTLDLDRSGEGVGIDVRRALVRSRAQLSYEQVQRALDTDTAEGPLELLREVGRLREQREAERGGISLPLPEQDVVETSGSFQLVFRAPLPVEGWNAQISLLTGMAAAELMLYGEIGLLRTLPAAPEHAIKRLRRVARALQIDWPPEDSYAEMIRTLDPRLPRHAAMLNECTSLLRGAGYTAFAGGVPELATHAAVASEYAHVTAPLRRLADRYTGEVCLALCAGTAVPDWARVTLPVLPERMHQADAHASRVEAACVDLVEAAVLADRVGERFSGVVVDVKERGEGGVVQLTEPAVRGRVEGR
ncbi:MAG: RNB domain-containing ribonuclease, partial [Sporichthyaceae bacterium]|nr:RNB domain-containing ribonuclease [Sporichthyaceae bacterium]